MTLFNRQMFYWDILLLNGIFHDITTIAISGAVIAWYPLWRNTQAVFKSVYGRVAFVKKCFVFISDDLFSMSVLVIYAEYSLNLSSRLPGLLF